MKRREKTQVSEDLEIDVTAQFIGKKMHELPVELQHQLLGTALTTDEDRLGELLRTRAKLKNRKDRGP